MSWTCGRCARIVADGADWCEKCGIGRYGGSVPGEFEAWSPKTAPPERTSVVTNRGAAYGDHAFVDYHRIGETSRYGQSYRMAQTVDRVGVVIIVLGLVLGLLLSAMHSTSGSPSYDEPGIVALNILAIFIQIVVTCTVGYLVRAVAAILRTTTDAAVQTSPLLTTAERDALLRSRE